MGSPPVMRNKIAALLKERGKGMTVSQMAEALDMDARTVQSGIRCARKWDPITETFSWFYICGWKRSYGTRGRWGAKYRLQPVGQYRQDKPQPKQEDDKTRQARYRLKNRETLRLKRVVQRKGPQAVNHWMNILGGMASDRTQRPKAPELREGWVPPARNRDNRRGSVSAQSTDGLHGSEDASHTHRGAPACVSGLPEQSSVYWPTVSDRAEELGRHVHAYPQDKLDSGRPRSVAGNSRPLRIDPVHALDGEDA